MSTPDSFYDSAYREVVAALISMRKAAGMSQRELAVKLGRPNSFVGRIETGKRRVDVVEYVWICRACGADPVASVAALVERLGRNLRAWTKEQ